MDAVCIGYGFSPHLDLAIGAGARLRDGFVDVDDEQATSVAGVFAAGEITGIGGADLAAVEGELAGYAAAAYVGQRSPVPARIKRRRARLRSFGRCSVGCLCHPARLAAMAHRRHGGVPL